MDLQAVTQDDREKCTAASPRVAYVVVSAVTKRYDRTTALDKLSFIIEQGEIYGLLGPNGAGKSTVIGILSTILEPTAGNIVIGGHSLVDSGTRIRRKVGIVPQDLAVYDYLTGEENIRFFGRLHGLRGAQLEERCSSALELTGLYERRKDIVEEYSGGMKQRLNFAAGVITRPDLLLLDEPMAGIDPQSRDCLAEGIKRLRDSGTTILYTTHDLEDAEQLCDRVGILDNGHLIAEGTISELIDRLGPVKAVHPRSTGLRDVFMELTGRTLRD